MSLVRRAIRAARDQPVVLSASVGVLQFLRSLGLMRSRQYYSHVPYRGLVTVESGGGSFRIRSRGHNIENALFWEGLYGHEPRTMESWVAQSKRSKVVLDIGANSGVFGLAAAAAGAGLVHAFEPLPRVFGILEENKSLNDFTGLHIWPFAVGEIDGDAIILDPGGDAPTSASLSSEFAEKNLGEVRSVSVKVVSIDSFVDEKGIESVDLIKLDVEGYEEFALRGMKNTVAKSLPFIFMEVLDDNEAELKAEVSALWPRLYDWVPIDEGGSHVSRNVLLVPQTTKALT